MSTKKCDIVVTTQLGLDYKALREAVVQTVREIVFIDLYVHCVCKVSLHACTDLLISEIFPSSFLLIVACCCCLFVLLYVLGTAVSLGRHSNGDSS